jgi:hypothetical protein
MGLSEVDSNRANARRALGTIELSGCAPRGAGEQNASQTSVCPLCPCATSHPAATASGCGGEAATHPRCRQMTAHDAFRKWIVRRKGRDNVAVSGTGRGSPAMIPCEGSVLYLKRLIWRSL